MACATAGFAIAVNSFDALDALHSQLGIAIFILAGLQPLLALVRPHKGTRSRVVFYAAHWTIGMSAVALGWYNIFTGIGLYGESAGTDVLVSGVAHGQCKRGACMRWPMPPERGPDVSQGCETCQC